MNPRLTEAEVESIKQRWHERFAGPCAVTDAGYLVPTDFAYEVATHDFRPTPPPRWQFWRRNGYRLDLAAWRRRVSEWGRIPPPDPARPIPLSITKR